MTGRPSKKTVDWFPHYCDENGKTLYILDKKYSNDGYAFWFKLLALLGRTSGHYYDTEKPGAMDYLSANANLEKETCIDILNLLSEMEAIDTDLWTTLRVIWVANFTGRLVPIYEKRRTEIPSKPDFSPRKVSQADVLVETSPTLSLPSSLSSTSFRKTLRPRFNKEHLELAQYHIDSILKYKPDYKFSPKHNINKWANKYRLMIERDNRDILQIKQLLDWIADGLDKQARFWQSNILSPDSMRDSFERLQMQYFQNKPKRVSDLTAHNIETGKKAIENFVKENQDD